MAHDGVVDALFRVLLVDYLGGVCDCFYAVLEPFVTVFGLEGEGGTEFRGDTVEEVVFGDSEGGYLGFGDYGEGEGEVVEDEDVFSDPVVASAEAELEGAGGFGNVAFDGD